MTEAMLSRTRDVDFAIVYGVRVVTPNMTLPESRRSTFSSHCHTVMRAQISVSNGAVSADLSSKKVMIRDTRVSKAPTIKAECLAVAKFFVLPSCSSTASPW
jgi:hypothetical protein